MAPATGPQKRRKPATARSHHKARAQKAGPARSQPNELEVDADVLEFIEALDRFRREHGRPFPNWSEVLFVLRSLGYRRP